MEISYHRNYFFRRLCMFTWVGFFLIFSLSMVFNAPKGSMDRKTVIEKCRLLYDLLACVKCGMPCSRNYRNGLCEHVVCTHCLKSIYVWKRICCGVASQGTMATPCKRMFTKDGLIPEIFFNQKFGEMLKVMKAHNVTFEQICRPKPILDPKTTGQRKRHSATESSSQELELRDIDLTALSESSTDDEPQEDFDRPSRISPRFPKTAKSISRHSVKQRAGCSTKEAKHVARRSTGTLPKVPTKPSFESVTSSDQTSSGLTNERREIERSSSSGERESTPDNRSPESKKKEAVFKQGLTVTSILPRKSARINGRVNVTDANPSIARFSRSEGVRLEKGKVDEIVGTPRTRQGTRGAGSNGAVSSPASGSSEMPGLTIATDNEESSCSPWKQ